MTDAVGHNAVGQELRRSTSSDEEAIVAVDLNHSYPGSEVLVLRNVSVTVRYGEILALVGKSGCGKTTLLNAIAGLVTPTRGTVTVSGSAPTAARRTIGYMFARDALLPWRSALGNVKLALEARSVDRNRRDGTAREWLERVGLADAMGLYPGQLSQGMRQRVALARTLVTNPRILLLDEPFAALDALTRVAMQQILLGLIEPFAPATILVTHDLDEALVIADRILVMRDGMITRDVGVPFSHPRNVVDLRMSDAFSTLNRNLWSEMAVNH